jgi:hypothetical protein
MLPTGKPALVVWLIGWRAFGMLLNWETEVTSLLL